MSGRMRHSLLFESSKGVREATWALGQRPGKPDDSDRPSLQTFPGRPRKQLDGQLDLLRDSQQEPPA